MSWREKRNEAADRERTGRMLDAVDEWDDTAVDAMIDDPHSFEAVVAHGVFGNGQQYPPPGHTFPRP